MPFRGPKKGERGEAALYFTRNEALKRLQLKLHDFRKLTVWKGVYPREPKSRKKAQQGDTSIKILYLKEDIKFLAADPMMWKIREEKIHREKVKSLKHSDRKRAEFLKHFRKPKFTLDHMVLERYPTFGDAIEDLSDPLTACFIYGALPNLHKVHQKMVFQCRKLTLEFLSFIIEAKCLRKAFITVKGYYYRAHIQGHKVTWMIPHSFTPEVPQGMDMRHMGNFIQFYITLLSFVNFKLFASLNLYYPPVVPFAVNKVDDMSQSEQRQNYIWSLNTVLKERYNDDAKDEPYNLKLLGITGDARVLFEEEQKKTLKQRTLFDKVKFFLGRETNRESLTFIIRSAGGLVSWDSSVGIGSTYKEDLKAIKYQIVDRPSFEKKYLTRYYVQPQWVYDSFNAGMLMPVQDYFVGVELPAHLSPFEETYGDKYVPPEMLRLQAMQNKVNLVGDKKREDVQLAYSSSEDEDVEEEIVEKEFTKEELEEMGLVDDGDEKNRDIDESDDEMEVYEEIDENEDVGPVDDPEDKEETVQVEPKKKGVKKDPLSYMTVLSSKPFKRNKVREAREYAEEDWKLRASFIHKKQKRLFRKILKREEDNALTKKNLKNKRIMYEKDRLRIHREKLKAERKKKVLDE